jgi:hypothetical protein
MFRKFALAIPAAGSSFAIVHGPDARKTVVK